MSEQTSKRNRLERVSKELSELNETSNIHVTPGLLNAVSHLYEVMSEVTQPTDMEELNKFNELKKELKDKFGIIV
jgi:hypothetical protein